MMPANGVDERQAADDRVVLHVAAPVEEFIVHVHAGGGADNEPAGVRGPYLGQDGPADRRHDQERNQRVRRKEHDPIVAGGIVIRRFLGEELMMRQRVPVIDPHQARARPVHHLGMQKPFEDVGQDNHHRDHRDLGPCRGVDVLGGIPQRRTADQIDQRDMNKTGVGRGNLGAIGFPKRGLTSGHHNGASCGEWPRTLT